MKTACHSENCHSQNFLFIVLENIVLSKTFVENERQKKKQKQNGKSKTHSQMHIKYHIIFISKVIHVTRYHRIFFTL